jgi:hypothetical protein
MPRGNAQQTKVVYKGKSDDFVVYVDSIEDLQKWKKDSSIPLAQVVNGWKVFCTHKYAFPPSLPLLFVQKEKDRKRSGKLTDGIGYDIDKARKASWTKRPRPTYLTSLAPPMRRRS